MNTELSGSPKVDGHEAIDRGTNFTNTVVCRHWAVVNQLAVVEIMSIARPTMKRRNGWQQFETIWTGSSLHRLGLLRSPILVITIIV